MGAAKRIRYLLCSDSPSEASSCRQRTMEEPDEVDYDDSDSDFADLDVEDEEDIVAQPKKANQLIDDGPTLLRGDREEGEATPAASPKVAVTGASSELEDGEFLMDSEPMVIAASLLKSPSFLLNCRLLKVQKVPAMVFLAESSLLGSKGSRHIIPHLGP